MLSVSSIRIFLQKKNTKSFKKHDVFDADLTEKNIFKEIRKLRQFTRKVYHAAETDAKRLLRPFDIEKFVSSTSAADKV